MGNKTTLLQSIVKMHRERIDQSKVTEEELKQYESEIIDAMIDAGLENITASLECGEKTTEKVTIVLKQYARGTMMTTYYLEAFKTYSHEPLKTYEKHRAFWNLTKDIYESDNYDKSLSHREGV